MSAYQQLQIELNHTPFTWCVTGAAGFIGSHLVEKLLSLNQTVIGVDNFSTGKRDNLNAIQNNLSTLQWNRFTFLEGDICDLALCEKSTQGVQYVLHQAALGSIPRSIADPATSTQVNVMGFLNMLMASQKTGVRQFVYASSSSVYGDWETPEKKEEHLGNLLSPYALTKRIDELYAEVFQKCYGINSIGLRYFNVFGPRQDPKGVYAAVIPKWIGQLTQNQHPVIFGDGQTSRDFCYIENVIQANLLSALTQNKQALNQCYNVAAGGRTSLNALYFLITNLLSEKYSSSIPKKPQYQPFKAGDVRHSQANIQKTSTHLGYVPTHTIEQGLLETVQWFLKPTHA